MVQMRYKIKKIHVSTGFLNFSEVHQKGIEFKILP